MKLKQVLAGSLALLITACTPVPPPTETDTAETLRETESVIVNSETEYTETEPLIQMPAEGTPGVFFADSFAVLQETVVSESFLTYP